MNILVTGSQGFVGKNLIAELKTKNLHNILEYDVNTNQDRLDEFCEKAEFVFHLAGINRPTDPNEFKTGNLDFSTKLITILNKFNNSCPVLISSSTQATLDNPYGKSKLAAEEAVRSHLGKSLIYRLPNVFGKWCRPNYNSAVATFCHNIANDLPITVNDRNVQMKLVYIDDVITEFLNALNSQENRQGLFCEIPLIHEVTLGQIVDTIYSFKNARSNLSVPLMTNTLEKKLYSTYLSYLPEDKFSYPLKMNVDNRGSFTEFIRTPERGQVSVNISKPGITKGNHWHHTKVEKFLVVSGKGVIRFRHALSEKIIEYFVSGEKLEVVDIPAGYTHNIENLGTQDMVTIMWANEPFDPNRPDTYFLGV
jgi:UDP-2-acetamido-2,6-beta-L-arabino-hexul-4-ose reductase